MARLKKRKKKKQEERNRNVENLIPKKETDARPRRGTGSLAEKQSLEKEGHGDQGMYGYSYGSKDYNATSSRFGVGTDPRFQINKEKDPTPPKAVLDKIKFRAKKRKDK